MAKNTNAEQFISRLENDAEFRLEVGPSLLDVAEGDWSAIIKIAKNTGYSFTKKQLLAAVPDSFFKGRGKKPETGWSIKTRTARKSKKAN
jgi:hypothetical protein